jgi:hypothetical protein
MRNFILFRWWRSYQRAIDKKILWPQIEQQCKKAGKLDKIFGIKMLHKTLDSAWWESDDNGDLVIVEG